MKLYIMKCVKDANNLPEECGGMLGQHEMFLHLTSQEEVDFYQDYKNTRNKSNLAQECVDYAIGYWDGYMTGLLGERVSEDDIYDYIFDNAQEMHYRDTYIDQQGNLWEVVQEGRGAQK